MRFGDPVEREGVHPGKGEAAAFDERAEFAEDVEGPAVVPAAEGHPVLLGAGEVGEGDDVSGAAAELDEPGQRSVSGDVQGPVDAAGGQGADGRPEGVAVGDGFRPE